LIDLDELEEATDSTELYCRFGVLLVTGRLSYQDWNSCVRALGIHRYVLPEARTINEILLDTIYHKFKKSSALLLWHSLLMGHIEAHYTETEQVKILGVLIKERYILWGNCPRTR